MQNLDNIVNTKLLSDIRSGKDLALYEELANEQIKRLREGIESSLNITPIKEFGTNYAEFYHKPIEAFKKLQAEQSGQIAGAYERKELGDIDLVWGKVWRDEKGEIQGYGLSKILDKHPEITPEILADIINNGTLKRQKNEAIQILKDDYKVVLKSNWKGEPTKNKWIVTSYEAKGEKGSSISSEPLTKGDDLPLNSAKDSTTKDAQSQINPIILQSNAHIGSGILGGMVAGIEQDENGNYTFNPQNFILGFLGGAAASKATQAAFKNPKIKTKAEKFAKVAFEKSKATLQDSNLGERVQEQLYHTFGKGLTKALDARAFMVNPAKAANQIKNTLEKEVKDIHDHIKDLNKWFEDMDIHRVDWDLIQKERTRLESNLNEITPKYEAAQKAFKDAIDNRAQTTGFRDESDIRALKQEQKGILTSEQEESVKRFYELETQIESLRQAYSPLVRQKDDAERLFKVFQDNAEELRIKSAIAKLKTLDEMDAFAEQEISKLRAQRKSYLPEADTKALENELKEVRHELSNIGLNNRKIKEWKRAQGGILTKEQEAQANHLRFLREQEKKLESKISSMQSDVKWKNRDIEKHNIAIRDKINFIFDEMPTMLSAERRGFDEEVEQNVKALLEDGYTQEQINALKSKAYDRNIRAQEILENYDTEAIGRGYDGYSMSNNARDAYSHNIKPLSKWNKEDADAFSELLGAKISLKDLKEFLKLNGQKGWHHTSMHYNKTDFYSLAEAVLYGREWLESRFGKDIFVKGAKGASGGKGLVFQDQKGITHTISPQTQELWLNTFGLKNIDETYIPKHNQDIQKALQGKEVRLQKGSLLKLVAQGREELIPQIKQVLDEPEAIIRDLDNGILFVKHIRDEKYIVSVNVDKGDYLVSISNHIKQDRTLNNKISAGAEVLYQSPNLKSSRIDFLQASQSFTNKTDANNSTTPKLTKQDTALTLDNLFEMQKAGKFQDIINLPTKEKKRLLEIVEKENEKIAPLKQSVETINEFREKSGKLGSITILLNQKSYDENLARWHKGSHKLTKNEDGTPKVFYHGTGINNLETFQSNNNYGHFFSSIKDEADTYSKDGGKTYSLYLKMKNPFEADKISINTKAKAQELIDSFGLVDIDTYKPYKLTDKEFADFLDRKEKFLAFKNLIEKHGFKLSEFNGDNFTIIKNNKAYRSSLDDENLKGELGFLQGFEKQNIGWCRNELDALLRDIMSPSTLEYNNIFRANKGEEFKTKLKAKGYDGIKFNDYQFSVFDSNQIKSVENKGGFNGRNPNIMYSVGGGGSIAGIEQDENGNYTFNPQNFILGFLGGAAGYKALSALAKKYATMQRIRTKKENPLQYEIYKKIGDSQKNGRNMSLLGKEALSQDTLAYIVAKNTRAAFNKLDKEKALELGFKYPDDVRRTIQASDIIHTLKRHGEDSALVKRSRQRAVSLDDIAKYQDYADKADIKQISFDKGKRAVLVSAKQVDNEFYVVVEQIRMKLNELSFKTMYFDKGNLKDKNTLERLRLNAPKSFEL